MLNGVINVYKERGYTSHDVVARLRGIFGQRKIGHTGTLDPDAEGVLPVCLGNATRLSELLTDRSKAYRAVLLLGRTTDTQDAGGRMLKERPVHVSEQTVAEVIKSFIGNYDQIPPMYSALKVNGKKLVDLARRGIEVERKPRAVEIYDICIEAVSLPRVTMTVQCSKGTYIRTLCHDIGEKLRCGGCMEQLTRICSGGFCIETAHQLGELEKSVQAGEETRYLIPTDACLSDYPGLTVSKEADKLLKNGNPIEATACSALEEDRALGEFARKGAFFDSQQEDPVIAGSQRSGCYRLYSCDGGFAGLYRMRKGGKLYPEKMFLSGGK